MDKTKRKRASSKFEAYLKNNTHLFTLVGSARLPKEVVPRPKDRDYLVDITLLPEVFFKEVAALAGREGKDLPYDTLVIKTGGKEDIADPPRDFLIAGQDSYAGIYKAAACLDAYLDAPHLVTDTAKRRIKKAGSKKFRAGFYEAIRFS